MTGFVTVVSAVSAVAFVAVAAATLRRRDQPGAVSFALLLSLCALGAAGSALVTTPVLPENWLFGLVMGTWLLAVPLWAVFAFAYTGRGPLMTRRRAAGLVGVGVAIVGLSMGRTAATGAAATALGVANTLAQIGLLSFGVYGLFVVLRSAVTYDDLPPRRGAVLALCGGGVVLLFVPLVAGTGAGPTRAWFAATLAGLALGGALAVSDDVFGDTPVTGRLGRETVFDAMTEAVVVVDTDGRIVDANAAAERTFGFDSADAVGRPVGSVLGRHPGEAAGRLALQTPDGRREFECSRSALSSRRGGAVGRAYLFRDVTERHTQEQRLDVLNRVFRHNLRNDLDAVRAFAETLGEGDADRDPAELAGRIETTARDLADIGATVERAERLLTEETLDREAVDAAAVARAAVDVARDDIDDGRQTTLDVQVDAPDGAVTVRTDGELLRTAIRELVANAVEHHDESDPTVTVRVRAVDGGVAVTVADDGPGIPQRERDVLLEGNETPLRHGTGVGLWLVYWAVTRLGGTLSFSEGDPRGSVVTVEVPDRPLRPVSGSADAERSDGPDAERSDDPDAERSDAERSGSPDDGRTDAPAE